MSDIKIVIELPEKVKTMIARVGISRIPDEMKEIVDQAVQEGRALSDVLSSDKAIGSVAILSMIHNKGLEDELFRALLEYEIREERKLMHKIQSFGEKSMKEDKDDVPDEERAEDKGLEDPEEDGIEK